ncbi:hypothetical protein EDE15_4488 [Edaphobacter aggregans]|uniref:Uncharacterized protein n=1 Tax=Edaphobacter aggregans TaxID=570835 RepID=A0A428MPS2_9BACT|nr:hypothetical protein EDE15_4488 [Edaphobacter aggregans]
MGIIASVSLSGENLQHTAAVPRKMFNLAHVNFVFSGNLAPGPFRSRRSFDGRCVWGAVFVIPAVVISMLFTVSAT